MEEIIGKEFSSFKELDKYLSETSAKHKEVFYIRSSRKLKESDVVKMTNKNLKYSYILYHCKFGKERESQSTGKRQSSTIKHNCKATITVKLIKKEEEKLELLQITEATLKHENHDQSKNVYNQIPQKHALDPQIKEEILAALKLRCNKKDLREHLKRKYDYDCNLKFLSNLAAQLKTENEDEHSLPEFVRQLQEDHGCFSVRNAGCAEERKVSDFIIKRDNIQQLFI